MVAIWIFTLLNITAMLLYSITNEFQPTLFKVCFEVPTNLKAIDFHVNSYY